MSKHIPVADEVKIVAYLARGETYASIRNLMAPTLPGISDSLIVRVKQRNKANLDVLTTKLEEIEVNEAQSIKQNANKLLKGKLRKAEKEDAIKEKLHDDYLAGELEAREYYDALKLVGTTSIPELVIVSKEMHQQTKFEPDTPPSSPRDLDALREAIKNGDEVALQQIIFNPKTHVEPDLA